MARSLLCPCWYLSGTEAFDSSDLIKNLDFAGRPDLNVLFLALSLVKVTYFKIQLFPHLYISTIPYSFRTRIKCDDAGT